MDYKIEKKQQKHVTRRFFVVVVLFSFNLKKKFLHFIFLVRKSNNFKLSMSYKFMQKPKKQHCIYMYLYIYSSLDLLCFYSEKKN